MKPKRGAVLVLAMLVLVALISVAFLGAEGTLFELNYVGANRLALVGQYVAEGGHALSVGQAAANPGVLGATNYTLTDDYFGGLFYVPAPPDSPGVDPESFGPEGFAGAAATFTTAFEDPITTNRVPGFSSDAFVFTKYTARTVGLYRVGTDALGVNLQRRAQGSVVGQIFLLSGTSGGR